MDDDDRGYWVTTRTADIGLEVEITLHDTSINEVEATLDKLIPEHEYKVLKKTDRGDGDTVVKASIPLISVSWTPGNLEDECMKELEKIAPELYDVEYISGDYHEYDEEKDWCD